MLFCEISLSQGISERAINCNFVCSRVGLVDEAGISDEYVYVLLFTSKTTLCDSSIICSLLNKNFHHKLGDVDGIGCGTQTPPDDRGQPPKTFLLSS